MFVDICHGKMLAACIKHPQQERSIPDNALPNMPRLARPPGANGVPTVTV